MTEVTNRPVADGDHDVVRYGVIGTGMMGCEHIANIGALNGVALTAVCDPHEPSLAQARIAAVNAANANNLAEEAPAPAEFSDDRALIDSGLCDAVVIATPNHRHVTPLLDAMAAGLHVLVEKPLCTTLDDCRVVSRGQPLTRRSRLGRPGISLHATSGPARAGGSGRHCG